MMSNNIKTVEGYTCKHCNHETMVLEPGKNIHIASLWCEKCKRFHKWLSKAEYAKISG